MTKSYYEKRMDDTIQDRGDKRPNLLTEEESGVFIVFYPNGGYMHVLFKLCGTKFMLILEIRSNILSLI